MIVGKRALPAIGLRAKAGRSTPRWTDRRGGRHRHRLRDGRDGRRGGPRGTAAARAARLPDPRVRPLSAQSGSCRAAEHGPVRPAGARRDAYHVLWELVHVFFDHRGLLAGREARGGPRCRTPSFLYPFLSESESDLEAVLGDVQRQRADEGEGDQRPSRPDAPRRSRVPGRSGRGAARRFRGGGKLLVFGNGGSATDAMDAVADFRFPPASAGPRDVPSTSPRTRRS